MDTGRLEELLQKALANPLPVTLNAIRDIVAVSGNPVPAEVAEKLDQLWSQWGEKSLDTRKARFALDVALMPVPESAALRKLMLPVLKALLPPYLSHNPVIKATGVRDENRSGREIAGRIERLLALRSGAVIFLEASGRWGIAGTADSINAVLPVLPFGSIGSKANVPLEVILNDAVILAPGPDLSRLTAVGAIPVSPALFRSTVDKRKLVSVSEARLKAMARSGCGRQMDQASFDRYWDSAAVAAAAVPAAAAGTRRACDGRSLKEISLLLESEDKAKAGQFSDDEIAAFRGFFERLKVDTAIRESNLLASIIAQIADRTAEDKIGEMLSPLAGKAVFFPKDPAGAPYDALVVWGELASKLLEKLALVVSRIYDAEYLAACATRLPLKALNALCPRISDEALCKVAASRRSCGADLLMWIWKNNKKRASGTELLKLVNLDNVSRILSSEEPPKEWGAARRELRDMLLNDSKFQNHLIAMLDNNAVMFGSILQSALFLSPGERQSLMVKLARQSKEIQEYLESGAGQKILNAGIGKNERAPSVQEDQTAYTSVKSHHLLLHELDDIINVQQPENRKALAVARAHGDFRENAEFDAAKERRNYLTRRRNELERDLANIQPITFSSVKVEKSAVIGSTIVLKFDDGEEKKYYLLGAWDGDPDRSFLSYRTQLGKAVLNHKAGDRLEGVNGRKCTLVSVAALPQEIITELDD